MYREKEGPWFDVFEDKFHNRLFRKRPCGSWAESVGMHADLWPTLHSLVDYINTRSKNGISAI